MPSDKDKGNAISINGSDAKKHKKKGKGFGWVLGVIILIILSLLLVLPVTAFGGGSSSVVFGSYNGEKIELAYGNYFFNQVNSLMASNPQNMLGAYLQAFNLTVYKTALDQLADQVGYMPTDKAVDDVIVNGGGFVNEDGQYDSSLYAALSDVEKAAVRQNITDTLPAQTVLNDIATVKVSDGKGTYRGRGLSTDVIEASLLALLQAVNRMLYEKHGEAEDDEFGLDEGDMLVGHTDKEE